MARRTERLLSPFLSLQSYGLRDADWCPRADIYQTAQGWLVKFELAGVRPDEVSVQTSGHSLLLSGVRRDMRVEEGQHSYSMEISYNQFQRRIDLPCEVDAMEMAVDYQDGMLVVRLTCREAQHES